MKKLILPATCLLLASSAAFAQPAKRTSAFNYLQYGELDNAKEAIDAASVHEKTSPEAKTWFYRGQIYQAIYEESLTETSKFKHLSQNSLQEAFQAFSKCNELDDKKSHADMTYKYLDVEGRQFVNEGIINYNSKHYDAALKAFENTIAITALPQIKRVDSLAVYYAGACAEQTGDLVKAEKYYRQSIAANFKSEAAFVRMARMYADAGNKEKAFEIVKEGRKQFPNNQTLVTEEVNAYLMSDRHAEAMEALNVAIGLDPKNYSLHFALGFVHDRLAAKALESKPEGGAVYDRHLADAEKSYKTSVELNPENFDAVYNLGALYFNRAVKLNEVANTIDDMKKFEAARKIADAVFDQSLPILESAFALNAADKGVLISLKQLYYRKMTNDDSFEPKYNDVVERLKTAQ
ncbi:MAG: tetratricopeptide repeat protein [Flavobacteriales bacterium]|nr:tetratricopeptide repeat protein [Flavobacteriales bacterium]